MKKDLRLKDCEWVIYPINDKNDPDKWNGGDHWSLLLYRKKGSKYMHFDSMKEGNERHAKELIASLCEGDSFNNRGEMPRYSNAKCEKQKNGYDCGIFVLKNMITIINNIIEGRRPDDSKYEPYKSEEMRSLLRDAIKEEKNNEDKNGEKQNIIDIMDKMKKNKKEAERKKNASNKKERPKESNEKGKKEEETLEKVYDKINEATDGWKRTSSNDNKEKKDIGKNNNKGVRCTTEDENIDKSTEQKEPCKFFMYRTCRFGNTCRNEHPAICKTWLETERCDDAKSRCKMAHPKICRSHYKREPCHRYSCKFVHPENRREMNRKIEVRNSYWQRDQRLEENVHKPNDNRYKGNFLKDQERSQYRRERPRPARKRLDILQRIEMMMRDEIDYRMGRRGSLANYYA